MKVNKLNFHLIKHGIKDLFNYEQNHVCAKIYTQGTLKWQIALDKREVCSSVFNRKKLQSVLNIFRSIRFFGAIIRT